MEFIDLLSDGEDDTGVAMVSDLYDHLYAYKHMYVVFGFLHAFRRLHVVFRIGNSTLYLMYSIKTIYTVSHL